MYQDVLEVKNLTKKFGKFTAVNKLSFTMQSGQVLGLLGPNGAGKTTTIQMLLGLMSPTFGEISYFGKNFYEHREEILKELNFSSTYISMPWLFTVSEILDIYARLYEIPNKKERTTRLLKEFEIDHLIKKQFYMLSAGEKTRLFLTKAFLNYPKLILLDEPTASLDPDIAVKIRKFLTKQKKEYNVSVLLTSHNMAEVEELCDEVIVIKQGEVLAKNTPANLSKKISDCKVELLIKNEEKAEKFLHTQKINYEKDKTRFKFDLPEKEVANFLMLLAAEKIEYDEIAIDKPDLEDFFLKVVEL